MKTGTWNQKRIYRRVDTALLPAVALAAMLAVGPCSCMENHMKLSNAAKIVEQGASETLSYYDFPSQHWRSLRTNNPLERLMREIRRRTRVVGAFPDGQSALMLIAARLRHVAGSKWGMRRYMNMERLKEQITEAV